ncbi:MAG: CRTAC1 family protein [Acidobacteria bacterium]|nr:CRTAC1 family protein [Acidobacteriota bacterium]
MRCVPLFLLSSLIWAQNPHFTEVTQAAGLNFQHQYVQTKEAFLMMGGIACADVNGDGWLDLYVLGGASGHNALFLNQGDGTFVDGAEAAGVALGGRHDCGPLFFDANGDGWVDLFVGGLDKTPTRFFRNTGAGAFVEETQASGLLTTADTFSAAAADIDRDGDLDLFTSHWGAFSATKLMRNDGSGHFEAADDVSGLGALLAKVYTFTPNFADINGDSWPDLLVSSDFHSSQVLLNQGNGSFKSLTNSVISDENGMGGAVGDFDNDGDLDWFVTSISLPEDPAQVIQASGNRLYRNLGNGQFADVTETAGVRSGYWGWGTSFADFNNDGVLDLVMINGFAGAVGQPFQDDPSRLFLGKGDGTFEEIAQSAGFIERFQGRGLVCFDYDGDGDLDIVTHNNNGPLRLYRNDGSPNHWLGLELQASGKNTKAIGARVSLTANGKTQIREQRAGNNYVSSDPSRLHFGLGQQADPVSIEIQWPSGRRTFHENIAVDQQLRISEPGANCAAGTRWLPHLTRPDGGFVTSLLVMNGAEQTIQGDIQFFSASGQFLGNWGVKLDPGASEVLGPQTVQAFPEAAYCAWIAPPEAQLVGSFAADSSSAMAADFQASAQTTERFRWRVADPTVAFDGIVALNPGPTVVTVDLYRVEADGTRTYLAQLSGNLEKGTKFLSVLDAWAESGTQLEAVGSQPICWLLLRGTRPGSAVPVLFQVPPLIDDSNCP